MGCTSACSLAFPSDDYTSGSAAGGSGAGQGTGNGGSGGCQGSACAGELQGDALVARYFINEAASGTEPLALDGAPGPDLYLYYQEEMRFGESDDNRGLFWPTSLSDGYASGEIGGTAVANALSAAQQATIELVVAVNEGTGTLLAISDGLDMTLVSPTIEVSWPFQGGAWKDFPDDGTRRVVHLRVDTAAQTPVELRVNGLPLEEDYFSAIVPNAALQLATSGSTLWLGNLEESNSSIGGAILYFAIYGSALTPAQVTNNVTRLLASDDGS